MSEKQTYEGAIMIRGKGTGFFAAPNFEEDILITPENLSFALDRDIVKIELLPKVKGERQEAKGTRIIEPAHDEFVGTVRKADNGNLYLQPDNHRIHVRPQLPEASTKDVGMKVVAEITTWQKPKSDPLAEITETLGPAGNHETEMQAIIRAGGFSKNFPPPVAEAAEKLYERREEIFRKSLENTKGPNPGRRDMRDRQTMTIDPKDAKDFDDALSYQKLENGNVEVGSFRDGEFVAVDEAP